MIASSVPPHVAKRYTAIFKGDRAPGAPPPTVRISFPEKFSLLDVSASVFATAATADDLHGMRPDMEVALVLSVASDAPPREWMLTLAQVGDEIPTYGYLGCVRGGHLLFVDYPPAGGG